MKERIGLICSSVAHAAVIAYAIVNLGTVKPFDVQTESMPIEILSPEEFAAMKGSKTSKKVAAPQQKTEQVADAESEPVDDDRPVKNAEVKAPPPPPQADAPAPKPEIDTAKLAAEKAAKADAEKAAKAEAAEKAAKAEKAAQEKAAEKAAKAEAAKAEAAKEAAAEKAEKAAQEKAEKLAQAAEGERLAKAEAEKAEKAAAAKAAKEKAEAEKLAKAEAEKAAKEKAEAEKLAKAEAEKAAKEKAEKLAKAEAEKAAKAAAAEKAAKEKAEAEKLAKAQERKFDPSKIASLLGKKSSSSESALEDAREPSRKAATGRQLAPETTAGTSRGTASKLSMSQRVGIDNSVREQVAQCWSPPVGAGAADGSLTVRVKFTLLPDGSLEAGPTVDGGSAPRAFADAAARAVRRCSPLKLPADAYDYWRSVDIRFDPKDMMGG